MCSGQILFLDIFGKGLDTNFSCVLTIGGNIFFVKLNTLEHLVASNADISQCLGDRSLIETLGYVQCGYVSTENVIPVTHDLQSRGFLNYLCTS